MSNIILYHFPKSSCSRKVVFVLAYKALIYDEVIINLERGEQKSVEFLKLNPHGQVPVLKYQNAVLYDSSVINEFLEEQFPDHPLLPTEPVQRARVRISTLYADREFYPHISRILHECRKPLDQQNQKLINDELSQFQSRKLSFLESSLQEHKDHFLFGQLTLADIAYAFGLDTLLRVSGLTLDAYPATQQWFKKIYRLPAFEKSISFALSPTAL